MAIFFEALFTGLYFLFYMFFPVAPVVVKCLQM